MGSLSVGRLSKDSKAPATRLQVGGKVPGTSGKEGLILRDRIKTEHWAGLDGCQGDLMWRSVGEMCVSI